MADLRFRYQTLEIGPFDVHVRTLRDTQQYDEAEDRGEALGISSATWPLAGVIWPSGVTLAHLMATYPLRGRRVLEVGCGVGLASLVLNQRDADITATDRHPDGGARLQGNAALNDGPPIPFERTDWTDADDELGLFDLIIASDVLYEASHVAALSAFIERHAAERCEVLVVDPGRGQRGGFRRRMQALGYACDVAADARPADQTGRADGQILRCVRERRR